MGLFKNLLNGWIAGDISEKHGLGAGLMYLEQMDRYEQINQTNKSIAKFENSKQELSNSVFELYNQKKEVFSKKFSDRFFQVMSALSASTFSNYKSFSPIIQTLLYDMNFIINVNSLLQEIREGLEMNSDNEKIKKNKKMLIEKMEEVKDSSTAGECRKKVLKFIEILENSGVKIKNKEEVLEKINTNWHYNI